MMAYGRGRAETADQSESATDRSIETPKSDKTHKTCVSLSNFLVPHDPQKSVDKSSQLGPLKPFPRFSSWKSSIMKVVAAA
jgi:hypothetical protein